MVKRKSVEVNWADYFQKIQGVCPWSGAHHARGNIDFRDYGSGVEPLGEYTARVYLIVGVSPRRMRRIAERLEANRPGETWFWSHPGYRGDSAPTACLIQQSTEYLEKLRSRRDY